MERTLKRIVNYTVAIAEPEKMILFGSITDEYRRNEFSDVDMLLILEYENKNLKKDIEERVVVFCKEMALKVDVLIYSPQEIKAELQKPHTFLSSILKHGKLVYQNNIVSIK